MTGLRERAIHIGDEIASATSFVIPFRMLELKSSSLLQMLLKIM